MRQENAACRIKGRNSVEGWERMARYRILLGLAAFVAVFPSEARACTLPLPDMITMKPPSAAAQQLYNNCIQQQRQVELQRQQMELQRRQMLEQQIEMQRQTRIQQQQLELQRQQLQAQQQQMQNYPSAPSGAGNLHAYLSEIARNYNAQLPLKLDDVTNLVHVEAASGALTIIHHLSFEVNAQDQIDKMATIVGPKACSDPVTKQNINVYRVKYVYRYFTPSGRYFDIFMNPGSC